MESSLVSRDGVWPPAEDFEALDVRGALTEGPQTEALEREASDELIDGTYEFVATNGGTAAIEAALRVLDVGEGDEVIVPAFTFAGSALPILAVGASPVFVDVDERTFNLDVAATRDAVSGRTKAIIAVHLHGLPLRLDELVADFSSSRIVEDCAQAYGARFADGSPVGTRGAAAAWSLNQTKTVFAGEGGLAAFYDPDHARTARSLRRFGFDGNDQVSRRFGGNWKLTEFSAAIARRSLSRLGERRALADASAEILSKALAEVEWLDAPVVPGGVVHAWHKYRATIADPDVSVDVALGRLSEAGIPSCRWGTAPLHRHPLFAPYDDGDRDLSRSERIPNRTVVIGVESAPLCSWPPLMAEVFGDRLATL